MARKRYGLDLDEYDRLRAGHCEICQRCADVRVRMVVDHDHSTGAVRGVLCDPCNQMLGFARDSPKILMAAIKYISSRPS